LRDSAKAFTQALGMKFYEGTLDVKYAFLQNKEGKKKETTGSLPSPGKTLTNTSNTSTTSNFVPAYDPGLPSMNYSSMYSGLTGLTGSLNNGLYTPMDNSSVSGLNTSPLGINPSLGSNPQWSDPSAYLSGNTFSSMNSNFPTTYSTGTTSNYSTGTNPTGSNSTSNLTQNQLSQNQIQFILSLLQHQQNQSQGTNDYSTSLGTQPNFSNTRSGNIDPRNYTQNFNK